MKRRHLFTLALAAVLAAPASAIAQALPDAEDIVARYVEAIGGRRAVMSAQGYHATGTFDVPAQGISGNFETYAAAPNRVVFTADVPGLGTVGGGYDGTTGWSLNPATGPMVLDGRMLEQMQQQANFHAAFHGDDYVASMETVEEADFEGVACYKVKIVTTWDEEYFEFFDRESGLLVGSIRQSATPMGEIEATTVFADYADVGGLRIPMKTTQRVMGFDQVITITSAEAMEVPDSAFALPTEIQEMIRG